MTQHSTSPNVLIFLTDQQRWDSTGVHGNPLDLTPNFDAFARRGTHLYHSFTCHPVCGPARAALQTGLYPTTTGTYQGDIPLPPSTPTLATHFKAAGYRTACVGKWHLAPSEGEGVGPVAPEYRGDYEYWLAANVLELVSDAYRTTLWDNEQKPVHLPGYRADAVADAGIRFIDRHCQQEPEQPFFLFLSFHEPHHQNHRDDYPVPRGYAEKYAGRWTPPDLQALGGTAARHLPGYWGMVKRLDEAFGRVLDALHSLGLDENTIVLFTSDHGCHFRTRNREFKRTCHDASIRIPAAIGGPGFDGGGQVQQLVSLVDLPPTLLDAAGLSVPDEMQGRSLMPVLRRETKAWPEEVFVQIKNTHYGRCVRTGRWKYSVREADGAVAKDGMADCYEEEYLYDLQADPYELNNLAGLESHRAVADVMQTRLMQRMAAAGEPPAAIKPAPTRKNKWLAVSEREALL